MYRTDAAAARLSAPAGIRPNPVRPACPPCLHVRRIQAAFFIATPFPFRRVP
ncbi:hypothetical protein BSLA_02f2657 [Burkholderia stabilis]|nr:hypothetical protein BSLA_02f2657 [Burkholderia stabilis]